MLAHALRCSGAGRVVIGLAVVVADWTFEIARARVRPVDWALA
jgi:hypothetical protein